jgi:hypothetical protein
MPANTNPIFTLVPVVGWGTTALATANTAKDGTGTVLTIGAVAGTNGTYYWKLRARPSGTAVATVLRIFINNGSTNATPANNILFDEFTLAATTLSEVAALAMYEIPLNIALPSGYKWNCTIGTTVAAGYFISVVGGDY